MQKGTRDLVHSAAKKGFIESDIKDAAVKLTEVGFKFLDRRGSAKRSKTDFFIDDILNHLYDLEDRGHMPTITVDSVSLAKMPSGPMAAGDNVEVSTRLGNLEKQLADMNVAIAAIAAGGGQVKPRAGAGQPVITIGEEATHAGVVVGHGAGEALTFAAAAAGGRGRPAQRPQGAGVPTLPTQNRFNLLGASSSGEGRPRSASQKRKMSDGSAQEVDEYERQKQRGFKGGEKEKSSGNRTKRQNLVGTGGAANVNTAGRVAPYEMYVGRTHPDTTEEDIRGLVQDYTKDTDRPDGVSVIDVDLLKEMKDQNDRIVSKCWRVTVAFTDKDKMMEASSWPAGWTYRQYFLPRQAIPLYKRQ